MHGLFRVRGFTQDDAHIFCLPGQIASEIKGVLDLTEEVLSTFGFTKYEVNLSTRPEKSVGDDEIWGTAEAALVEALGMKGWDYVTDQVGRPAAQGAVGGQGTASDPSWGSLVGWGGVGGQGGRAAAGLSPQPG